VGSGELVATTVLGAEQLIDVLMGDLLCSCCPLAIDWPGAVTISRPP